MALESTNVELNRQRARDQELIELRSKLEACEKDRDHYRTTMHAVDQDGDSAWDRVKALESRLDEITKKRDALQHGYFQEMKRAQVAETALCDLVTVLDEQTVLEIREVLAWRNRYDDAITKAKAIFSPSVVEKL